MATASDQDRLFAAPAVSPVSAAADGASVFTGNMRLPVHRWFRYSAGFSALWVEDLIRRSGAEQCRVLDPFAGSGTSMVASQAAGAESIGIESHPFVARVAEAKLQWDADQDDLWQRSVKVLKSAEPVRPPAIPDLLARIFPRDALERLYGLRRAIDQQRRDDAVDQLLWLALVAILRACSPVGTAPWQYVLPRKTKAKAQEPLDAFEGQVRAMCLDMAELQASGPRPEATLLAEDARTAPSAPDGWANLVVTSPPYPNNYDYADATRIEMTFLGEVEKWGDLQDRVRTHLIHSCSQHMRGYDAEGVLNTEDLQPIADELRHVYGQLAEVRESKGGRKAYHLMVVAYFADLAKTWRMLRRVCDDGAQAYFIVGDSAPYGVHVPVERWLGSLAVSAGFENCSFEKLRDRNVKWRNRKHRVPLQEGILKVTG